MYGDKGVLKKQLWSQETGASGHRNGNREPPFVWTVVLAQTGKLTDVPFSRNGEGRFGFALQGVTSKI